ncbi:MAG: M18 family aminopeptidase [Oscillospiraceae bacterium]|nr:M18 family aminopeptidase [Oscillospiraceae bacterium]
MVRNILAELQQFLLESPGCFHAVAALKHRLDAAGFTELRESERWQLTPGQGYYVSRNGSSLLSFRLPKCQAESLHIIASHSDSPSFKLKPDPALWADGVLRLNVEGYGGMIRRSWFDRPLSVAGRVIIDDGGALRERLVYVDRDLLLIPSLAIHLSRDSAEAKTISVQNELLPLLGLTSDAWARVLSDAAQVSADRILGADLFLTCREKPTVWGADGEFLSAPRLDDLACCYASFAGFLDAKPTSDIALHAVFDNEEVGSRSMQGAESDFLAATVRRILLALGMDEEGMRAAIARSFLVSADNAHALHPNYAGKYDLVSRPKMNGGIVLKRQAGQKYTTDAVGEAVFRAICRKANVPVQDYANHSDVPGGSTLGNISNTQLSIRAVDIGLAQLAMHSAYETMGSADATHLARFAEAFYGMPLPKVE